MAAKKRAPAAGCIPLGFRPKRPPGETDAAWLARCARTLAQLVEATPGALDDPAALRDLLRAAIGWSEALAEVWNEHSAAWQRRVGSTFHAGGRTHATAVDAALDAARWLGARSYGVFYADRPREEPDLADAAREALARLPGLPEAIVAGVERETRLVLGASEKPSTEEERALAAWEKATPNERVIWKAVAAYPGASRLQLVGGNAVSARHRREFARLEELGAIESLGPRSGYRALLKPPSR